MEATSIRTDETTRTVGILLIVLLVVSFGYSVVIMGSFLLWLLPWAAALGLALASFLIYLFYRLVVAVETIADEL